MKAVMIHGVRDVRVAEVPPPDGNGIPVDVSAVGICGSDLHYYLEGGIGAQQIRAPFVPGHEFAGRMADDYEPFGLRRGELVAIDPARPCGVCEWCRRGHVNLCPHVEFAGAPPHGGAMTERIAVEPHQIHKLPAGMTASEAVMLETLGVSLHAIDLARPQLLESVAVIGCGPVGLCAVQLLRNAGVGAIMAVDPVGYRADAAAAMGATHSAGSHAAIADWTGGRGADLVIEATNAPQGFQLAAEAARIGGRVVLVGIPEGNVYTLTADVCRRKGLGIKFSRRMGDVYPRTIRLAAEGRVDLNAVVSHRVPLAEAPAAFAMQAEYRDHALKTLVCPNGVEPEPRDTASPAR
ncbi:MAG: alcohol dehydrogenase catalytic domain-containing protein [Alphaproteobacteria bacterium]